MGKLFDSLKSIDKYFTETWCLYHQVYKSKFRKGGCYLSENCMLKCWFTRNKNKRSKIK